MRRAYTLIEIMVAVAILSIALTVSFPVMQRFYFDVQLKNAEKQIITFIESQRNIARSLDAVCRLTHSKKGLVECVCSKERETLSIDETFEISFPFHEIYIYPDGRISVPNSDNVLTIDITKQQQSITVRSKGLYGPFERKEN